MMIQRAPKGTFTGKNFMTPAVIGYFRLTEGWAELASGRGLMGQTSYGVTVRTGHDQRLSPDPSHGGLTYQEALDLIESLGGKLR